ncbi:unnamed protein product, partial [marine sediment metagenome]
VETKSSRILQMISLILSEDFEHRFTSFRVPYGKGYASQEIVELIESNIEFLSYKPPINYRSGSK